MASGGDSSTERSPIELAMSWRYDEQSDVEQHVWQEGPHEDDFYKETGASRSGVDLSNAVSLDPPSSSSSPCWPAMSLSVAQQKPQTGAGDELEQGKGGSQRHTCSDALLLWASASPTRGIGRGDPSCVVLR